MMTVVPIFVLYESNTCPSYQSVNSLVDVIYFILCGMSTTRILRALRFRKYFAKMEDEVQRFLANMCLYIVVMILFSEFFLTNRNALF
jgi:hypothetical protein